MRIARKYSHLNGEEWLLVHEHRTYRELLNLLEVVDVGKCRIEQEERQQDNRVPFDPVALTGEISRRLAAHGWKPSRFSCYVAHTREQLESMSRMGPSEQRHFLLEQGIETITADYATNHARNRIAVEVQFGQPEWAAYDLFVKHVALYSGRAIEVGIEVLPTRTMQQQMAGETAYYEGELNSILRHGRANPPVPLVIIGVEP